MSLSVLLLHIDVGEVHIPAVKCGKRRNRIILIKRFFAHGANWP